MKVPILLKIADIMKIKALKLYYRYQQNEFSRYFDSVFTETNDNHTHDTRHDFFILITDKDEHWAVMCKTLYTRYTYQNNCVYN